MSEQLPLVCLKQEERGGTFAPAKCTHAALQRDRGHALKGCRVSQKPGSHNLSTL